jgi:uncharacterized protein YacL
MAGDIGSILSGTNNLQDLLYTLAYEFIHFSIFKLLPAAIVLILAYFVGRLVGSISREIIAKLHIDESIASEKYISAKPSHIADIVTRWIIYLVGLRVAVELLEVKILSEFIGTVYTLLAELVGASVIILVGYIFASYLRDKISVTRNIYSEITANAVFFLIVAISISMGLSVIEFIKSRIYEQVILIVIAGLSAGMAIAIGLGLKDVVAEVAREAIEKERKKKAKREEK